MPTPVAPGSRHASPSIAAPDEVLRFQVCERHLHWAIAIPFKTCYLTALILVTVYNPAPDRPLRDVFAWLHRLSGVCLALLPPLMLFIHRREFGMHLRNVREAWSWRFDDIKWLLLMGPATVSNRVTLPHQGKFNAAEKINFIVVMCTYPMYIATGFAIWFLRPAYLSWMIHLAMALAATPLVLGHVFMATVNPDTRVGLTGMISGWVSREWARHHYRLWYDEQFGPHHRPRRAARSDRTLPLPVMACAPAALRPELSGDDRAIAVRPSPPPDAAPTVSRMPALPAEAGSDRRPSVVPPRAPVAPPTAGGALPAAPDPSFAA